MPKPNMSLVCSRVVVHSAILLLLTIHFNAAVSAIRYDTSITTCQDKKEKHYLWLLVYLQSVSSGPSIRD